MTVFISHSHKDEAVYSTLCIALDSARIRRWDVSEMTLGDSLSEQLRQAIADCGQCIFVATRRSIESQWCLAELGAFWGAGKTVILFLADPDLDEAVLPPQFRGNLMANDARRLIAAIQEASEKGDNASPGGDFQGTYCDSGDSKFTIEFHFLGNAIYKLDNPSEHWDGVGFIRDGQHYFGVYRYKDNALPRERRGEWGLHRGEVRETDGALEMQTLGASEDGWSPTFLWCRR